MVLADEHHIMLLCANIIIIITKRSMSRTGVCVCVRFTDARLMFDLIKQLIAFLFLTLGRVVWDAVAMAYQTLPIPCISLSHLFE